jgi:hypothetical protein
LHAGLSGDGGRGLIAGSSFCPGGAFVRGRAIEAGQAKECGSFRSPGERFSFVIFSSRETAPWLRRSTYARGRRVRWFVSGKGAVSGGRELVPGASMARVAWLPHGDGDVLMIGHRRWSTVRSIHQRPALIISLRLPMGY